MTDFENGASQKAPLLLEWWKPFVDFEGIYEISNIGNVRRIKSGRGTKAGIIKSYLNKRLGYMYVYPSKNAKNHTVRVHKAVAVAFLGAKPEGFVVDHINSDKQKNWASNLEYVTQVENVDRAIKAGRCEKNFAIARSTSPLDEEKVRDIKLMAEYISYAKIARQFGMNGSTIRMIVLGESWGWVV